MGWARRACGSGAPFQWSPSEPVSPPSSATRWQCTARGAYGLSGEKGSIFERRFIKYYGDQKRRAEERPNIFADFLTRN